MAPSGLVADGLSTALFASSAGEARRLLARCPDCRARVFAKDGTDMGEVTVPA